MQDFLELVVQDNDGNEYVVRENVSPAVWEAFVSMQKELMRERNIGHAALDAVEMLMSGEIVTK